MDNTERKICAIAALLYMKKSGEYSSNEVAIVELAIQDGSFAIAMESMDRIKYCGVIDDVSISVKKLKKVIKYIVTYFKEREKRKNYYLHFEEDMNHDYEWMAEDACALGLDPKTDNGSICDITKGNSKSADEVYKRCNPHFDRVGEDKGNCQLTVLAMELQCRGYEVVPISLGSLSTEMSVFFDRFQNLPNLFFSTGLGSPAIPYVDMKIRNAKQMYEWLRRYVEEGRRYFVMAVWANSLTGHAWALSKKDGILTFYDPQEGLRYTERQDCIDYLASFNYSMNYKDKIMQGPPKIFRMDNAKVRTGLVSTFLEAMR